MVNVIARYIGIAVVAVVAISLYRGCFESPLKDITSEEPAAT